MVEALLRAGGLMRRSKIDADALAPPKLALTPDPPTLSITTTSHRPLVAVRWGLTHLQLRLSSSSRDVETDRQLTKWQWFCRITKEKF